jgi:hypothetical protein
LKKHKRKIKQVAYNIFNTMIVGIEDFRKNTVNKERSRDMIMHEEVKKARIDDIVFKIQIAESLLNAATNTKERKQIENTIDRLRITLKKYNH